MIEDPIRYLMDNQERLGLMMLRHCMIVARRRYGWSPEKAVFKGKDPEMIVEDVIRKYVMGDRHFKSEHSVESQLKRGLESWMSALYKSKDSQSASVESMTEEMGEFIQADGPTPDVEAANSHDTEVLLGLFMNAPEVEKSEELQLLLMAIEDGADDAESQSAATGILVKRVYQLRRTLQAIYPRILAKFGKTTE
jgi:hypothetical protein